MTERRQEQLEFQALGHRQVVADFKGGAVTSDAGSLLLREVESQRGWVEDLARCFADHRNPELIEHTVKEMVMQRVVGLALGYEDLNDHDLLRHDPLLAVVCGKTDPTGGNRRCEGDKGKALAGKSTLNRLELGETDPDRYKRIVCDASAVERLFVEQFISRRRVAPARLVLDLDATDDPLHGQQEGRFFHGYYGNYCYLPLYIFCGSELLCAKLRPSNIDASAGALEEVQRIVGRLREVWPDVQILVLADSGFMREELMAWCEGNGVDYVLGLSRNARLERLLGPSLESARRYQEIIGRAVRVFTELNYRTLDSWSRTRRVIGKAEYTEKGDNPRFIVTSLGARAFPAQMLYEDVYCARGDMENRIKEQQLDLFADRTSTATLRANQFRLWLSSVAYCFLNDLRELGLAGTRLAKAQCGTIRTRLMKIGALVCVSVRRVLVRMAESCPFQDVFVDALLALRALPRAVL